MKKTTKRSNLNLKEFEDIKKLLSVGVKIKMIREITGRSDATV